jgi:hypothetical protein
MEQFASQQKIFLDNIQEKGTVLPRQAVIAMRILLGGSFT